jgi:hypothetical protein
MLEGYNRLINSALKNVPYHLRDDCYQAACLGLLSALKSKDKVKNFHAYAYSCMKSEILNEIATLMEPMSVGKNTYILLCKYNKLKSNNGNFGDLNISNKRLENISRLSEHSKTVDIGSIEI